jgi:beta-lactamase regulating signal transducer with metallopeptidase domain/tetratricopeptide (TPR) repeat protein
MTLMESVIRFSVDLVLKATVLFLLTGAALLALRKASAATRHFVGVLGLSTSLLLPLLSFALPRIPVPLLPDPRPAAPVRAAKQKALTLSPAAAPASKREAADADFSWRQLALSVPEKVVVAPDGNVIETRPAIPARASRRVRPSIPGVLLTLWAAGMLAVAARLTVGWSRVRRISREAEPIRDREWIEERDAAAQRLELSREVPLVESAAVPVAMTTGLLKPLLLLGRAARNWAVERRRVVLLHELAHVKRGDWPALLLAEAAAAVYWFHPVAWWISRRVRRDAETACDDLVIAAGTKPSVYAGHLLGIFRALSTPAHPVAPALAMVRPHQFEERLRAILDPRSPREHETRVRARLAAAGLLVAAAAVAAVEPWKPVQIETTKVACKAKHAHVAAVATAPKTKKPCNGSKPKSAPVAVPAPAATTAGTVPPVLNEADEPFAPVVATEDTAAVDSDAPEASAESAAPEEAPQSLPAVMKFQFKESKQTKVETSFVKASNGHRKDKDWYDLGMGYHHDEEYEKAIEAFQKAIDAGQREEAATYNIACGYALMGDKDQAFAWLQKALDAGFDVGAYMRKDDDLDSLHSDPRWAQLKNVAKSGKAEREEKAAISRYERLASKNPTSGEPFFDMGRELLHAEQYDLAAKAYQAAIERNYRLATSLYNRACALSLNGDKRGALDMLAQSLEAGFDQPDLFRTDDDLDNVRNEPRFKELQKEAKDLSLPPYNNGWNWFDGHHRSKAERAKWREAAERFEDYAQKNPNSGRAWYNLGFASLAGDRPEPAVEAFQKALALNYRKSTTMYNLACTYSRMDQKDQAFDWLFKALDAGFDNSGLIRSDDDLDNLRGDPRYRKALQVARGKDRENEDSGD